MAWTKRKFVEKAFGKIGLAAYVFDLGPDQLQDVAQQLDSMMSVWNGQGIRLGYPLSSDPDNVDLDTECNVPDSSHEAIFYNLAVRIAPDFGKMLSPEVKTIAHNSYMVLLARAARPNEIKKREMPAGSGNKTSPQRPFLSRDEENLTAGPDGPLDFN